MDRVEVLKLLKNNVFSSFVRAPGWVFSLGVACVVWGGCIDDEKTRPYAEFVEDYNRILDMRGGEDLGFTPDLAAPLDMASDAGSDDGGVPDQGAFMLDRDNPPECSLQGGPSQTVTFVNGLDRAIDLYWIHFNCATVKYVTLQPGASYDQSTFVGHVWDYSIAFGSPLNRRVVVFEDTTTITLMEE